MGHLHEGKEAVYRALAERLSRFPVGAVVNENLMEILKILYTEAEAAVGAGFPFKPIPFDRVKEITGIKEKALREILGGMAAKGLVVDIPRKDTVYYLLSPMVVGFFEYTFMRTGPLANRRLAELFESYFADEGVVEEIFGTSTKMFRALVYEKLIPKIVHTEVMSYEKASEVIRRSKGGSLSMCACRHKAHHLGKACRMPVEDICTSLGRPSEWLVRRGFARQATVDELLRNLERSERLGLVLLVDNVIDEPAYICHCCGCCCGVLRAINEKKVMSVQPGSFIAEVEPSRCLACAACEDSCHIHAVALGERDYPVVNRELCIGCGVCVNSCPSGAMVMIQREVLSAPPKNKIEQIMRIGFERGRLEP